MTSVGPVPPSNTDAEVSVLGSMLIDNSLIDPVSEMLKKDDFYSTAHQCIFSAIVDAYNNNSAVDLVILKEELTRMKQLETAGDVYYLMELQEAVPVSVNVLHYAKIVKEKKTKRDLIAIAIKIQREAYDDSIDPDKLLSMTEQSVFDISQRKFTKTTTDIHSILQETWDYIEELQEYEGKLTGIPTGFTDLDEITCGLQKGELIIIAARPSMGKTSLVLNIAENTGAKHGIPLLIFSMEMSAQQISKNMLCSMARIDAHLMRTGKLSDDNWARIPLAMANLSESPISIDDTPGLSLLEIRAKARRFKLQYNIQLIIVDYLQLMEWKTTESRQQEITSISRGLKALARELEVPVIAVSQLNRSVETREGHTPRMSDLRESGAIEQDADVIMLLHREDYYDPTKSPGTVELNVAKQRNGPTGKIKLRFLRNILRFENHILSHFL